MSSGVNSGQGIGIGNSQISLENYEYLNKIAELQEKIDSVNLTYAQNCAINTIINVVKDHLTENDYSGVKRDIIGDPIPNGKGGYFDHVHEMKDAYRSLNKAKRSIEGSLKNPNLGEYEKTILKNALEIANNHIKQIDNLFYAYGGIYKWKN